MCRFLLNIVMNKKSGILPRGKFVDEKHLILLRGSIVD